MEEGRVYITLGIECMNYPIYVIYMVKHTDVIYASASLNDWTSSLLYYTDFAWDILWTPTDLPVVSF